MRKRKNVASLFVTLPKATVEEINRRARHSNATQWEVVDAAITATKDAPPFCGRGRLLGESLLVAGKTERWKTHRVTIKK